MGKALQGLAEWTERTQSRARLSQLEADFFEQIPLDDEYLSDSLRGIIDAPAIVNEFILEVFYTARFGKNGEWNVVDDYLKNAGRRGSARDRRLLASLRDSSASLFEVVEVDPKKYVKVRDLLLRRNPVTVWGQSISARLGLGDRFAAHLLTVGSLKVFPGCILPYQSDMAKQAQAEIRALAKKARRRRLRNRRRRGRGHRLRRRSLRTVARKSKKRILGSVQCSKVLLKHWVMDIVEQHNAPLPELRNSDDEMMVSCQVRFPIKGDPGRAAALIGQIAGFDQLSGVEREWVWSAPGSPTRQFTRGGEKKAEAPEAGTFPTTLGDVRIEDGVLRLRVNSVQRAERGRSLLSTQLGSLLGPPQPASREEQQMSEGSEPLPPGETPHPEEVSQAILQLVDEHYRRLLQEPIAKLGGATVREAMRTEKGRQAAVAWVKEIEDAECDRAVDLQFGPYDTRWIWKELGLERSF